MYKTGKLEDIYIQIHTHTHMNKKADSIEDNG